MPETITRRELEVASGSPEGRVPPQAIDIEAQVIGAMLLEREAIAKVIEVLDEDAFHADYHRKIFQAILAMFDRSEPVDIITLSEELRRRGHLDRVGGETYLVDLTTKVSSGANVEYHARIVLEKSLLRSLIAASSSIAARGYSPTEDAFDLLDEAEQTVFQISEKRLKKSFTSMHKAVHDTLEMLESIHGKHGGVTGVPTGFPGLDDRTGGWQNSDLIIIAGRPSSGKTALALALSRNAALHSERPTGVGIFSLEMSMQQLIMRLLCAEARTDAHAVRTGRLPDDQWKRLSLAAGKLSKAQIFIDDSPSLGVLELRAKARRLKAERNVGLVIVDYLQLMQGPKNSENREKEISAISRSLKALAKELAIPVIALSQLSRAIESRADRRPILSDLRESGAIEQDADVVAFVHRPEIYEDPKSDQFREASGKAEIIIGKQRNGPIGEVELTFLKNYARFETPPLQGIEIIRGEQDEETPF